jgi:DNA-binding GntR family transcriptional regulator
VLNEGAVGAIVGELRSGAHNPYAPGVESQAQADTAWIRLHRPSTVDAVASALRKRLTAGEYASGEPMRESVVAHSLAVSRPTVREALQQLTREGLLTHQPHRGTVVAFLTDSDIEDIYRVRSILEGAGIAAMRTSPQSLEVMEIVVARFARAVSEGDALGCVDADMELHNGLVALTGSDRLVTMHLGVVRELRLALSRMDLVMGDARREVAQHRRLIRELKSGQVDTALAHLRLHLERGCAHLTAFVQAESTGPVRDDQHRDDADGGRVRQPEPPLQEVSRLYPSTVNMR